MSFIVREKWLWIIIVLGLLVLIGPYTFMWLILQLPSSFGAALIWTLIFGSGIAAGYRDWRMDVKKRERSLRFPE
jgi:hypothetical protein